jgi:REP element-mobilizing transposase RayT
MTHKFKNTYRIKSARLAGYDYRNEGLYFVTICTKNKFHYFGEIENGNLVLNEIGLIAHTYSAEIPQHFDHVSLDEFVIMPDHIHGIISIDEKREINRPFVETLLATYQNIIIENEIVETYNYTSLQKPKNQHFQNLSAPANSLSTIIRSFKSAVTIGAGKINPNFEWQSRFHDHIIRDVQSFERIRNYIINNPANWG